MIKSRIIVTSFLCLLIFNINACESSSPSDKDHSCQGQHNSSLWNTAQNAVLYPLVGYVIYKIVPPMMDPMFDYIQTNIKHLYLNHWLTEEQKKALQTKQEEEHQKLLEDFQKAQMKHIILFTKTSRGENILLREKEQEIRHNNLLIKEDELKIFAAEREESSKQIAYLEELKSKTSDHLLQNDLQKKQDNEIRKWMNSR